MKIIAFFNKLQDNYLLIILNPQMRNLFFIHHITEGVFELHFLNEEIVFRVKALGRHGRFVVKREPFLDASHPRTMSQIHKEHQI